MYVQWRIHFRHTQKKLNKNKNPNNNRTRGAKKKHKKI